METHYLADILILLGVAVIAGPVFQRLGLGSVLGYLTAGAVVGRWGFGFIDQIEEIRHIAEFGVVLGEMLRTKQLTKAEYRARNGQTYQGYKLDWEKIDASA